MALIPSVSYRVALSDTFDPIDGTWTAEPDFHSVELTRGISPTIDRARFAWPFGTIDGARVEPLAIEGKFVRIEILETDGTTVTQTWYGYIADRAQASFDIEQVPASSPAEYRWKYGDQIWTAYGLEWFLARQTVAGPTSENAERVRRAIGYNVGVGDGRDLDIANRGSMEDASDPPAFDFSDDAVLWDAYSICRHLLANQCPRDSADGASPATWTIASAAEPFLDWYYPIVEIEHQSVLSLLDRVIDRNRGLVWWLEVTDDGDPFDPQTVIELQVSSSSPTPVALPNGAELPEALNQTLLYHDTTMHADPPKIDRDGSRRYHRVRVRGARRTTTFTALGGNITPTSLGSYTFPIDINSTMVRAWTLDMQTQYREALGHDPGGGTVDPDYATYDDKEKANRNDHYRRLERFASVFRHYTVTFGQDTGEPLSPEINQETGSIVGVQNAITRRSVRLMRLTPLIAGMSYEDATAPVDTTLAGAGKEPRPPILFAYLPIGIQQRPITFGEITSAPEEPITSSDHGWRYADELTDVLESVYALDATGGNATSYRAPCNFEMRVLEADAGVWITPAGNQAAHRLDFEHSYTEPTRVTPSFDHRALAVTVTAEWDSYCEATYPLANLPEDVPLNELVISIGERARFDWLTKGTIYDINQNGVPLQVETGGAVRDDRELCEQIARLASAWYDTDRAQLTWSGDLGKASAAWYGWKFLTIGKLITGVQFVDGGVLIDGDGETLVDDDGIPLGVGEPLETVNATISQVTYDLSRGKISLSAGFAEIDFSRIV